MEFNTIIYAKDDGIGIITLNRPKAMNALSYELMSELKKVLEEIAADDEIFVVIITGSEKVFSAGADVREVKEIKTPLEAHRFETTIQPLFQEIEKLEKPVIAAVSGLALGGGCEVALACDLRIASENAVFGQPEIKIGIMTGAGGSQRLPRLIGVSKAKELLFTGDSVDAKEARRIGLINTVVPVESLMEEAKKLACKLKAQPFAALKTIKMAINEGINMDLQSALAYEARCFEILFSTEDQKQGLRSFLEKTKPVFRGK